MVSDPFILLTNGSYKIAGTKTCCCRKDRSLSFEFKAPIEVLQTLINLQPKITSKKFSSGRMALHIAACSSVTVDVIEYIFDQNTHAINNKETPKEIHPCIVQ